MNRPQKNRFSTVMTLATAISIGCCASSGMAQDKTDKAAKERPKAVTKADKNSAKPAPPKISPEREAAAIAFAQANHPELAALLEGLKRNASAEYHSALVELDRAVDRLAKLKDKPERHEFELAEWKMTSRIRLLAAKLSMESDPTVEAELRHALRERLELRIAAQRTERDRLQGRVSKLDSQIEEMTSKADTIIEKQFLDLRKTLPDPKPATKAKPKKATATPVETKGEKL